MGLNRYKAWVSGRVMWEEFVWPSFDSPPVDWPQAEEKLGWSPWIFIYQVWYNQKMVPMNCFSAWLHTHHTPWVEHNFMIVIAWVINIKSLYLGAAPRPWTPRARVTPSTRRGTSSTPHFPPPLLLQHHSHLSPPDDVCDISFANCVTSLSKIMARWKYTRVPIMTNINCLQTVWQCFPD